MPSFGTVVQPYLKSTAVFQCTSEHPFEYNATTPFNYFQRYGGSYQYVVYPPYLMWTIEEFETPAQQYMMSDIAPWHGGTGGYDFRINELFADFHAKDVAWEYYLTTVVPYGL
jgi:hypothetical protein